MLQLDTTIIPASSKFLWSITKNQGHFELLWFFDSKFFSQLFILHITFFWERIWKICFREIVAMGQNYNPCKFQVFATNNKNQGHFELLWFFDPKFFFSQLFILHITFFWERILKICFREIVAIGYIYHPCKFQVFATNNKKSGTLWTFVIFWLQVFFFSTFYFYT